MPQYKNESTANIRVVDENGKEKVLAPGSISFTDRYYKIADLTKLSDLPYINIVAAYHVETFTVAESHTIVLTDPSIPKIRIQKADGNFDIFLQSESNTPAILQSWESTDFPIDIVINGICDQIIVKSNDPSGTIQILELLNRWYNHQLKIF